MAADRGQRRAQLVRDRHQEVALQRLGLGEPVRHLAEALASGGRSRPARFSGTVDVVVARRDLVGRAREREHRPHEAPREVPREQRRRRAARAAPAIASRSIEREHALADVGLLLRDDDRADRPVLPSVDRLARPRGTAVLARRRELERQRLARRPVDRLQRQPREPGRSRPGTGRPARRSRCGRRSRARGSCAANVGALADVVRVELP